MTILSTPFMEQLNGRYSSTILLDATYNFCNNGLILFMGVVKGDEGYQPVFAFTCYDKTTETIAKALLWLKTYKNVQPQCILMEICQAEFMK